MRIRLLALAVALAALPQTAAAAAARDLYALAQQREQAARSAMTSPAHADAEAKIHAAVSAYRAIVLRFPNSGYSDNALWQAGCLSLDAFVQFGRSDDRQAGERLLAWLQKEYPASRLAKQVPQQLARVEARAAPSPVRAAPAAAGTGGPAPSPPRDAPVSQPTLVTVKRVRRVVLPDSVRVIVEMDGEVAFHDARIDNPDRVFVDLPLTRVAPGLADRTIRYQSDNDVVRQVRIGRHENHTTRIVIDAANVSTYSVYALYAPNRLVIDCGRASAADLPRPTTPRSFGRRKTPAPLATRALVGGWAPAVPDVSPPGARALADAYLALAAPPLADRPVLATDTSAEAPATAAPLAAAPARNLAGGFSIARQLGLGVSRIVIDPGHGGHDPGAQGKGITEADLVLDVSLRLEKLLNQVPGVEVILTRRSDEFVPLQERTAIANREGADLFLSIHANASRAQSARGVETFFLNFADNLSAAAVAARENAASGQTMGALPDFVKAIALNNKLDESRDFATMVQNAMIARLQGMNRSVRDLGVRQAPFVVLIGAAMPSVLAEISFITNPQDASLLRRGAYRQRIAEALFTAVRKYQTSLKTITTAEQYRR